MALSAAGTVAVVAVALLVVGLTGAGSHAREVPSSPPPIRHTSDLTQHQYGPISEDPHHEVVNPAPHHPVSVGRATRDGQTLFCTYNTPNPGASSCGPVTPVQPTRFGPDVNAGVSFGYSPGHPVRPEGPLMVSGTTGTAIVRVTVTDASTGHTASSNAVGADLGLGVSFFATTLPTGTGPVTLTGYDTNGNVLDTVRKSFWPPHIPVDRQAAFVATGTALLQPDWPVKIGHAPNGSGGSEACSLPINTTRYPGGLTCYTAPKSPRDFAAQPEVSENAGHDPTRSTTLIAGSVGTDIVRLTAVTDDGRSETAQAVPLGSLCACKAYGFHLAGYVHHVVLTAYDRAGRISATWAITNGPSLAASLRGDAASASAAG
jgi:hypothetical protein